MVSGFKSLHPLVLLSYYVVLIILTMLLNHPAVLVGLIIVSFLNNLSILGFIGVLKSYRFSLPIAALMIVINPIINNRGNHVLFVVFKKYITLEGVLMGFIMAGSLVILIALITHYQKTVSDHQFIYVFGRVFPKTALLTTMTTRFLPTLKSRYHAISFSRDLILRQPKSKFENLKTVNQKVLMLLSWSLETGIMTADSMEARGYGMRKRTNYFVYKWRKQETLMLLVLLLVLIYALYCSFQGRLIMNLYPYWINEPLVTGDIVGIMTIMIVAAIPVLTDGKELIKWHFMKSRT